MTEEIPEQSELWTILNHVRTTLLECDMICDSCTKGDKQVCIANMKTALYELCSLIEREYTIIGIVYSELHASKPEVKPKETIRSPIYS